MNHRKRKKHRKNLYINLIDDAALEISIDHQWRKKLFSLPYGVPVDISYRNAGELPEYIRGDILRYRLEFQAMRVDSCPVYFDDGFVVFMFGSKEYPQVVSYSGNNPNVI